MVTQPTTSLRDSNDYEESFLDFWKTPHCVETLLQHEMLEEFRVYKPKAGTNPYSSSSEVIAAEVKFSNNLLDGYPGVIHGGVLALIFDEVLGWACLSMELMGAVTANLTTEFKKKVPTGSRVHIRVCVVERTGRKILLTARMTSPDQSEVYAEAQSLFIIMKSQL